jgi:hypothetical protein
MDCDGRAGQEPKRDTIDRAIHSRTPPGASEPYYVYQIIRFSCARYMGTWLRMRIVFEFSLDYDKEKSNRIIISSIFET